MYKNRQERSKENDTTGKNIEDQNQCIQRMFAENKDSARGDFSFLGKRDLSSFDPSDIDIKNLTMKHLMFFLENDPRFSKSKYTFKAYMSR